MFTKHILFSPAIMQGNYLGLQKCEINKFLNMYMYVYICVYKFGDIYTPMCLHFSFIS